MNHTMNFQMVTVVLAAFTTILVIMPYAAAAESDSVTITGYIMPQTSPVADFSANPVAGPAPLVVRFTDRSTGYPVEWAWDFNSDGTTDSTRQNPTFTYTTPGSYTVSLRVINAAGSETETKADLITVTSPDPAARITILRVYVAGLPAPHWAKWLLDVPLRNAGRHVEKGNKNAAVNQMRLFTNNVQLLRWVGIISHAQAEHMIAEADTITALIRA